MTAETPHNWAGNVAFAAARVDRPASLSEAQDLVQRSSRVRVLGTGHSFNRIADSDGALLSLSALPRVLEIDRAAQTVTIDGGMTYAQLVPALHAAGFGLSALASLPHITVAGAVSTATHGSGNTNQNLSAAVVGLELINAQGELISYQRGDSAFEGVVVGLGAMGVVSTLTLQVHPTFTIRQSVYLDLSLATLLDSFDAISGAAYSVSLFTRWCGDHIDQVWLKALAETGEPATSLFGARAATRPLHPLPEMDAGNCTVQMGIPGPWHERLFHFPIGYLASAGAELQSEYFVPRRQAADAIRALHAVQAEFADALFASEIRTVAADALWLSTAYGEDMVGFHFTWRPDWTNAIAAVQVVERALAPLAPRPHWAKVFSLPAEAVHARYPRMGDFRALAQQLDPTGKFRNSFLDGLIFS